MRIVCWFYGHTWLVLPNSGMRICRRCGSYKAGVS